MAQAVATATPTASDAPDPADAQAAVAGTYDFVGGTNEQQARNASMEAAVSGLFFMIRPFARMGLEMSKPVPAQLDISFERNVVLVNITDGYPAQSPVDGSRHHLHHDIHFSHHFNERNELVETFITPNGGRTNVFVPMPDGKTLEERVEIKADKLPKVIRFTLTYRKQGSTFVASSKTKG